MVEVLISVQRRSAEPHNKYLKSSNRPTSLTALSNGSPAIRDTSDKSVGSTHIEDCFKSEIELKLF